MSTLAGHCSASPTNMMTVQRKLFSTLFTIARWSANWTPARGRRAPPHRGPAAATPVSRCCTGAGRAGAPAGTVRAAQLSAVDGRSEEIATPRALPLHHTAVGVHGSVLIARAVASASAAAVFLGMLSPPSPSINPMRETGVLVERDGKLFLSIPGEAPCATAARSHRTAVNGTLNLTQDHLGSATWN